MGYRLSLKDEGMAAALRRVAGELLEKAGQELASPKLSDQKRVHQLRKRMKMMRGLIRLVRPDFPPYRDENAAARDAARGLSVLRDADVMIATYDTLCDAYADEIDRRRFAGFRRVLTWRSKAHWGGGETPERLAAYETAITEMAERAATWQVPERGFKVPAGGLAKTYRRARRAMAAARTSRTEPVMHEWRKRVKYHWYHARLLQPIAPAVLKDHARLARDLSEVLGDHHDLFVFEAHLEELSARAPSADVEGFRALIRRRQAELEAEAFEMGERLLSEKPEALVARWRRYWKDWQRSKEDGLLQACA